jgi:hypothetical protein
MTLLLPPIESLGTAKKVFLTPLTRYWLKPWCDKDLHHMDYSSSSYLPAMGASVFRLRDLIHKSVFTRRTSNFRVLCDNRLIGIDPQLSDEVAKGMSRLWGADPVYPLPDAYEMLARAVESDKLQDRVRYINPPGQHGEPDTKRQKLNLSQSRQCQVEGRLAVAWHPHELGER